MLLSVLQYLNDVNRRGKITGYLFHAYIYILPPGFFFFSFSFSFFRLLFRMFVLQPQKASFCCCYDGDLKTLNMLKYDTAAFKIVCISTVYLLGMVLQLLRLCV